MSQETPTEAFAEEAVPRSALPSHHDFDASAAGDPVSEEPQREQEGSSPVRHLIPLVERVATPLRALARAICLVASPSRQPGEAVAAVDAALSPGQGQPKRRRISRKMEPPPGFPVDPVGLELPGRAADSEAQPEVETPPQWIKRRQAIVVFTRHQAARQLLQGHTYEDRKKDARDQFNLLSEDEQERWMAAAREERRAQLSVQASEAVPLAGDNPGNEDIRAVGFLATWNGGWGHHHPTVQQDLRVCAGQGIDAQCSVLRENAHLRAVFDDFRNQMLVFSQRNNFVHMSCCMELSSHSDAKGRVHLHCFMSIPMDERPRRAVGWRTACEFNNKAPGHFVHCFAGRGKRGRARSINEGHFYLQVNKTGMIHRHANYRKNEHYLVMSRWVLDMWRLRKLSHESAIKEIIASRDHATHGVQEVQRQMQLEYDQWSKEQEDIQRRAAVLRPFKPPTAVEQQWLRQYIDVPVDPSASARDHGISASGKRRRYRVLVYDGPSQTGKSERAMHWFTEAKTLRLNCQKVASPCMKEFLYGQHAAIVFEETTWAIMWESRQLFQAGPARVLLGQSQCNEHAYSVWAHAVPFIICSNEFWNGCRDPVAKDWIEKNIYYQYWDCPTWVETPDCMPPTSA